METSSSPTQSLFNKGRLAKSSIVTMIVLWACTLFFTLALLFLGSISRIQLLKIPCSNAIVSCLPNQLTLVETNVLSMGSSWLNGYAYFHTGVDVLVALTFIIVAVILFIYRTSYPMTLFTSFFFLAVSLGPFLTPIRTLYPEWGIAISAMEFIAAGLIIPFMLIYPNGKLQYKWTKKVAILWIIGQAGRVFFPGSYFDPNMLPAWASGICTVAFFGSAIFVQFIRYRSAATTTERNQLKWIAYSVTIVILSAIVGEILRGTGTSSIYLVMSGHMITAIAPIGIPISIGIAILRTRLWDIDVIINRSLLYTSVTGSIAVIYILIVGSLGSIFHVRGNTLLPFFATAIVAIIFQPLREHIQKFINRLTFGDRDDPYAVISKLSRQLHTNLTPEEVMNTVVTTIAQSLKLPYVAISVGEKDSGIIRAHCGLPVDNPILFSLSFRGELVGQLILAPRSPGDKLSKKDERLLEDLARQAGEAVHIIAITQDLQRTREHLVTTREEERMRLRRDLHDGLGPTLASLLHRVDTARFLIKEGNRLYAPNLEEADAELVKLKQQVKGTITDIRRLVYQLRPPVLDQLGLVSAMKNELDHYKGEFITFRLHVPNHLPVMTAAMEIAVYRIFQEAITNVVRHSQASCCTVTIRLEYGFVLEIVDNGCGFTRDTQYGVGIYSMQERAKEIGGSFEITGLKGEGTSVCVRFPSIKGVN